MYLSDKHYYRIINVPYDLNKYRLGAGGSRLSIPTSKISAWIEAHFEYKTRKEGTEYVINNPFNGDSGFHFNICPAKGVCHDWRGNEWAGPVNPETNSRNCSFINFVRKYRKCSYSDAIKELLGASVDIKDYLRPENRITDKSSKQKYAVKLPSGVEPLISSDDPQTKPLFIWLKSRGYDKDDIAKHNIQHLGMDVYWPYYEFDTLVYWQSRSRLNKKFNFPSLDVYDDDGKIIGRTEGSKGEFLYGFDEVEPASYVIITEAIFDQHTLGEQTLASGGAVLTQKQISKIKAIGPKKGVILSPDNDGAGIKSIIENFKSLSGYYNIYYSLPPEIKYEENGDSKYTKDWNELYTKLKMPLADIRKIHDERIKPLKDTDVYKLSLKITD